MNSSKYNDNKSIIHSSRSHSINSISFFMVVDFPENKTKYEFTKTTEKPKAYDDAVKKVTW